MRRDENSITLSNLSIYYTWKKYKTHKITINLKYQHQHGIRNLDYLMDHILYWIFKIMLDILKKKHGENTDNPSVKIYVNKIENRITFKIKNGFNLELLTLETMKLLRSTENNITKDNNGENVPHLEIT